MATRSNRPKSRPALARRHARRGVTVTELALIMAAVGLIIGAFALVAGARQSVDDEQAAEKAARHILSAVESWKADHGDLGCPTLSQLVEDDHLDADARMDDPWGSRYRVLCESRELEVRSSGKDGRTDTDDDVSVRSDLST